MTTDMTTDTVHLWFNGYDLAPGRTEDEALRWLMQETGEDADNCDGDGWRQWPDDEYLHDEDGSIPIPAQTCAQVAREMLEMSERDACMPCCGLPLARCECPASAAPDTAKEGDPTHG